MVTQNVLFQFSPLTDVEGYIRRLPKPYDRYIFLTWYHDTQYGSDEYGCTSLPNIFHHWIVDLNNPSTHINLHGVECTNIVLAGSFMMFKRQGRWYILHGSYAYPGDGKKTLVLIDITNITSPQVVKVLKDTLGRTDSWYWNNRFWALYNEVRDEILLVDLQGNIRRMTFDQFLAASDFSAGQVLKTVTTPNGYAINGFVPFDKNRAAVIVKDGINEYQSPPGTVYEGLYDLSTGTLTDLPIGTLTDAWIGAKYYVKFNMSGTTLNRIDIYDKATFQLVRSISVGSTCGSPWPHEAGDIIIVTCNEGDQMLIVNVSTGGLQSIPLTHRVYGPDYNAGRIIHVKGSSGITNYGQVVETILDNYYYADYNPSTGVAIIRDQAGNPVPNKQIIVEIVRELWKPDGYDVLTTDASGAINLSQYAGRIVRLRASG